MGDDQKRNESSAESKEPEGSERKARPRFEVIDRRQMLMLAMDLERLVDEGHPVRAIWEFVGRLDLTSFSEDARAVEGERGRPGYDPRLMISLWVYGYSKGVSSAREIARQCEHEPGFQWLTGMKVVNHHSLSDFRVNHGAAVDNLFTEVLAVLMGEGLVSLQRVMHDGTKIESCGSRRRYRTGKKINEDLEIARKHVEEMKKQADEDGKGRAARARERASRERVERLESAQKEYEKLRAKETKKERKQGKELRVSNNESEARIMKYRDGRFAPGYNAQLSTDQLNTVIVGVGLSQAASDSDELEKAIERIQHNTKKLPEQVVLDGGYVNGHNIHMSRERGIELITPASDHLYQLEKAGIDKAFSRQEFEYDHATDSYRCVAGKVLRHSGREKLGKNTRDRYRASAADCSACHFKPLCCPKSATGRSLMRSAFQAEMDIHAAKMQTEEARVIYKQRGQTAEFPSAWIKEKIGLRRFRLSGLAKAGLELIWACLTYNIQQWIRLSWKTKLLPQIQS